MQIILKVAVLQLAMAAGANAMVPGGACLSPTAYQAALQQIVVQRTNADALADIAYKACLETAAETKDHALAIYPSRNHSGSDVTAIYQKLNSDNSICTSALNQERTLAAQAQNLANQLAVAQACR